MSDENLKCQMCQGAGMVDTGGQMPWGAWIEDTCPFCNGTGKDTPPCPVCGFTGYHTDKCDKCAGVIPR